MHLMTACWQIAHLSAQGDSELCIKRAVAQQIEAAENLIRGIPVEAWVAAAAPGAVRLTATSAEHCFPQLSR